MARFFAPVAYVVGALLVLGGALTWWQVSDTLAAEGIVVSEDASCQAGQEVNGPLEAYCQADIINEHALHSTDGKTYAQLDRDDPLRAVAMNASFLRASLFTSVVAFGLAGTAMLVGFVFLLLGWLFPHKE